MHDVFSKQANVAGDAGTATAALCLPQPMTENHFRSKYFTKNKTPQAYLRGFVDERGIPRRVSEVHSSISVCRTRAECMAAEGKPTPKPWRHTNRISAPSIGLPSLGNLRPACERRVRGLSQESASGGLAVWEQFRGRGAKLCVSFEPRGARVLFGALFQPADCVSVACETHSHVPKLERGENGVVSRDAVVERLASDVLREVEDTVQFAREVLACGLWAELIHSGRQYTSEMFLSFSVKD